MDITRVTPPDSILVHEHNSSHGRRRSTSRTAGLPFSSRPPGPMAIRNTKHDPAPPPLPPPRFIDDLTAGSDPGWEWANHPGRKPSKAGVLGAPAANFPKSWGRDMGDNRQAQLSEQPQYSPREIPTPTIRSSLDAERRRHDFARHQDEGYYSLSGPRTSAMSQQSVYSILLQNSSL